MNILGIAGSPRLNGNSTSLLKLALDAARGQGHLVELLHAVELGVQPCLACDSCKRGDACVVKDDMLEVYFGLEQADALVVATPIHSHSMSGWLKPIVDRGYALFDAKGNSRLVEGKKLFVITAQADELPDDGLAVVSALNRSYAWAGFVPAGSLVATGVKDAYDWEKRPELKEAAARLLTDTLGYAPGRPEGE
jgi:multimeric flavodoxin WrbA